MVQKISSEKVSEKSLLRTSSQDGSIGKRALPIRTATEKITTRPQNKYHPEPSENQTVRKSDYQGFKEATFLLKGRKSEDKEMSGET